MVSILIPTYNYDVTELVINIWQQCQKESFSFEIIVIDDCSTNLQITEKNKTINDLEFCQFIQNKQNIGRTANRNLLCEKSKYHWNLFLDADVLPKYKNFIHRFNLEVTENYQVIYGGISYDSKKPAKEKILRWSYGKKREAKSVNERLKKPYFIISQNLMIKKDVFLSTNSLKKNMYGLDILFSNNLKKKNIKIKHIDNPIVHLGLETANIFLKKSLESVETTINLEKENLLDKDLRPLQKSYLSLQKWHLTGVYCFIISKLKSKLEKNFLSLKPNLFWFDLYRLFYYIKLKSEENA